MIEGKRRSIRYMETSIVRFIKPFDTISKTSANCIRGWPLPYSSIYGALVVPVNCSLQRTGVAYRPSMYTVYRLARPDEAQVVHPRTGTNPALAGDGEVHDIFYRNRQLNELRYRQ